MTEEEWLAGTNPRQLFQCLFAEGRTCARKLRLYACACSGRADHMGNTTSLALLQTAEQYADGIVTDAVRKQARQKAFTAAWWSPGKQSALSALARRPEKAAEAAAYACGYFFDSDLRLEGIALLRDIFGNPFRPVTFDPAWRTSTAVGVAEAIYADRTFDNLPVLADALQDAGCDHPDILTHLRDPGPHVRGCWALDLVLGKE